MPVSGSRPEVARREAAADGSVKLGLRLADGALIEAVYMPGEARFSLGERVRRRAGPRAGRRTPEAREPRSTPARQRFTVCLSSQTGCAVDCAFCVTGRLGAGRNLSAGEILGQLYAVLAEVGRTPEGLRVVFMGMGEPLLNLEGLLPALSILFESPSAAPGDGLDFGHHAGALLLAALPRRPNLAVSVNAADEACGRSSCRSRAPIRWPGCSPPMRAWPLEPRRRLLVEYVLIAGVNDGAEDARRLSGLLKGLRAKINVIPLNEDPTYLPQWRRPAEAVDRSVRQGPASTRIGP